MNEAGSNANEIIHIQSTLSDQAASVPRIKKWVSNREQGLKRCTMHSSPAAPAASSSKIIIISSTVYRSPPAKLSVLDGRPERPR
jgi:hypothetical protein